MKPIGIALACLLLAGHAVARSNVKLQHSTLTATDGIVGDDFGISVAIDGNTVVVGTDEGDLGPGAAYVFVKPGSGWENMTQTAELTPSDGQAADLFGFAVAISGNTIAVSAPQAAVNGSQVAGAIYVFVEPQGGWRNMTETAKLTASDGYPFAELGQSLAIAGDTLVGGNVGIEEAGAAYVFVEPSGGLDGHESDR